MLDLRVLFAALLASALVIACLDAPHLSVTGAGHDAGAAVASPPAGAVDEEPMVLVAATPLSSGSVSPQNKPDDKDKGKKGEADASAPPPPPTTTTPSTPVVAAFWIDVHEVSVAAYARCVAAGACPPPCADAPSDHPVSCVTLEDARAYCAFAGKRLLEDDEFTAAAAGTNGRAYPWGDAAPAPDRLDACGAECSTPGMYAGSDGFRTTAPRGSFPLGATPDGVLDLAGNVAEWVDSGVARGGSFEDTDPAAVTSVARRAAVASPSVGFRCARTP